MDGLIRDYAFVLRFYPFESGFTFVVGIGVGLFVGAAVMRWALS